MAEISKEEKRLKSRINLLYIVIVIAIVVIIGLIIYKSKIPYQFVVSVLVVGFLIMLYNHFSKQKLKEDIYKIARKIKLENFKNIADGMLDDSMENLEITQVALNHYIIFFRKEGVCFEYKEGIIGKTTNKLYDLKKDREKSELFKDILKVSAETEKAKKLSEMSGYE